jgi:hypothetical protein
MLSDINELEIMCEKLRKALVATLDLKKNEKVFVGNEEKMFLYGLSTYMPDSLHLTTIKIKNYKELTYHTMMDLWGGEIAKRPLAKKNQRFSEKPRQVIIKIRGFLIKINHLIFLKSKLKRSNTIIHYGAHLRYGNFVIPELTKLYFKVQKRKDIKLREVFSSNLSFVGFAPVWVEYLSSLFPTSHLESYKELSEHNLTNIKIDKVATSLSGVMSDPLLSFLIKNNSSKLIYVQHGGGPGLNKNILQYQLEHKGADIMYYWGTGENNVYPTRYRNKFFSRMNQKVLIVLSDKKNENTIKPYINLATNASKKWETSCIVVAHPNGPRFKFHNIQYGVGYKQHEEAKLVIYDNIFHSLLYPRIITRRPFLVLDSEFDIRNVQNENARKFVLILREARILISFGELEEAVDYWMKFSLKELVVEFDRIASFLFNHVLDQQRIETIMGIK